MKTVFIAGSIKIKNIDPAFVDRIKNIVRKNMAVVVGDANGADTSIQRELVAQSADYVTVYCTGEKPRNNVGHWRVRQVSSSAEPGTRAYFTEKDLKMAEAADFGLMLWDGASTGTLSNVIELLQQGKKSVVFVNRDKRFIEVKAPTDIHELVSAMSVGAKRLAEQKIGLHGKISKLVNEQPSLAL
ncbi:hypothetical protein [Cognatiyoonia sp. IB215182]|uniref:hypothetical protein n=1 Tax=Cognatiyoonia sp. IB215182 TaxID=3097353 RepID=UPI002A15AD06|nr:hypothetical protein [Cognatiyoonia sp. IB215182]MDX8355305.1 hypothetical protein [Cognatiyoonia sp. IB215182]